jgi:hypothetical protein
MYCELNEATFSSSSLLDGHLNIELHADGSREHWPHSCNGNDELALGSTFVVSHSLVAAVAIAAAVAAYDDDDGYEIAWGGVVGRVVLPPLPSSGWSSSARARFRALGPLYDEVVGGG